MLLAQNMAPRSSGFLEEHFNLSGSTRTAKTGKDWKCKYCDYLGKAWDGPARGKAHLAGQGECGVAACPKVPEETKKGQRKQFFPFLFWLCVLFLVFFFCCDRARRHVTQCAGCLYFATNGFYQKWFAGSWSFTEVLNPRMVVHWMVRV